MPGNRRTDHENAAAAQAESVTADGESLRHESFYVTGTWIDEHLGVYCGWVARDGSFSARMPLRDPSGEAVLVFSGEEYSEA